MSETIVTLSLGHNTILMRTVLAGAYCMRHDIPIIIIEPDNTEELLLNSMLEFDKATKEASFKLRKTAFERRNPNQPWWRKFNNKSKRK